MNRIKKFNEGWNPFAKKKDIKVTKKDDFLHDLETDNFRIRETNYGYTIYFGGSAFSRSDIFWLVAAYIKKTSTSIILIIDTDKYEKIGVNEGYRVKVPSLKRAMDYMEELESKLKKHNENEDNKFNIELKD